MGSYTFLVLDFELKSDIPQPVRDALELLLGNQSESKTPREIFKALPTTPLIEITEEMDDRFFETQKGILTVPAQVCMLPSQMVTDYEGKIYLSIRCLLNQDGFYESFLEWIAQYSQNGFAGYWKYEEQEPSLIYFKDGQAFIRDLELKSVWSNNLVS